MAGKIPRRTPEEQAAYDERTRRIEPFLKELHERAERERARRARVRQRRERWRRLLPFLPAS
jgi:hypothetical protein